MAIKFLNGQSIAGNLTLLGTTGNPKLIFSAASYDNAIIETGTTYAMNVDMQDAIYQLMSNSAKTQYAITGSLSTVDVVLNYGGSNKLQTTNTGVTVSGVVSATGGNSTQWNSAYAKTNAFTTIGTNFTKIPNVSAVSYTRINANETISLLSASQFRSAIGAGTSSSSGVTSISADTAGNRLGIAVKDGSTSTPEIGLNINGLATKSSPENWDTASITLLAFDGDETDDNVQIEIMDLLALAGSVDGSGTNGYIPKWNGSTGLNNSSTLYNGISGRLNINNTFSGNPSYGSDADLFIVGHNATTAACLTLMNGDTTGSPQQETGKIEFGIKDDASSGYISTRILSRVTSTPGQGYAGRGQLELQTSAGGSGSSPNTRVVVDYRGYVGLNELTPDERLEVKGTIKATDYKSSDGSTGITGTFTIVDKYSATRTLTIKNGLITAKN